MSKTTLQQWSACDITWKILSCVCRQNGTWNSFHHYGFSRSSKEARQAGQSKHVPFFSFKIGSNCQSHAIFTMDFGIYDLWGLMLETSVLQSFYDSYLSLYWLFNYYNQPLYFTPPLSSLEPTPFMKINLI